MSHTISFSSESHGRSGGHATSDGVGIIASLKYQSGLATIGTVAPLRPFEQPSSLAHPQAQDLGARSKRGCQRNLPAIIVWLS